jgi:D-beta-D-heptose 7-phosphate kinase/D-beta-D-heptose 1-phosphate adenosyltransferase
MILPDIFANGGDRTNKKEIREAELCDRLNIEMIFGVGGDKVQSSSRLVKEQGKQD